MIAILSLLHVVMSLVIQFDKSIHPTVLYENDLIIIFMNVYVNLQKMGKYSKTINLGEGRDWYLD